MSQLYSLPVATASVLAAGAVHLLLSRLRRGPVARLRRRGRSHLASGLSGAVFATELGVWAGVVLVLTDSSTSLRMDRECLEWLLHATLEQPVFTLGDMPWTLADLLMLPLLFGAVWIAASAIVRVVAATVLPAIGIDRGAQQAGAMLLRHGLVLFGFLVVLEVRGVDLRSLAIAGSVLGVGIGFGLQNIANNFVSGLLLHFERPIRAGDYIQMGELTGTVERIGARSTEISTHDRVTILVPNSRFLESEVINWSYGSPVSRVRLPIGVDYKTSLADVRRVLLDVARSHRGVLAEPRPAVQLKAFGDSSLDLELLVWTRDPASQGSLRSDLYFRIDRAFRRAGIEVPSPQCDVDLRTPGLERLIHAALAHLDPRQTVAVTAGDAKAEALHDTGEPFDDHAPEQWSDEELAGLASRMRGSGGVPVATRRYLLSTYPSSFVGSEAVEWLRRCEGLSKAEALAVGERLVALGLVSHVLGEHGFRDGYFFYRFDDDSAGAAAA